MAQINKKYFLLNTNDNIKSKKYKPNNKNLITMVSLIDNPIHNLNKYQIITQLIGIKTFTELSLAVLSQQISMSSRSFPGLSRNSILFEDTKRPRHMCKPTLCWRENLVDFNNTECQQTGNGVLYEMIAKHALLLLEGQSMTKTQRKHRYCLHFWVTRN